MPEKIDISDLDLYHPPIHWFDPIVTPLPGKHRLIGYLAHDDDPRNPLENCDGMGTISEDNDEIREALLLDQYGEPDLEPFMDEATKKLRYKVRRMDLICLEDEVDRRIEALVDSVEQTEAIAMTLWKNAERDPTIVMLRGRDGSNWQEENDLEKVNGIWYADRCLCEHLEKFPQEQRRQETLRCCEQALGQYQLYTDGDCYGIVTEVFDRHGNSIHEEESAWGFLGQSYAEEELAVFIKSKIEHFKQPGQPEDPNQLLLELNEK